jgi:hypothetical protein
MITIMILMKTKILKELFKKVLNINNKTQINPIKIKTTKIKKNKMNKNPINKIKLKKETKMDTIIMTPPIKSI